ncbi:SDR family oxidoreductase [Paenibacillus lignilyticus]|uniref:SDR family oxidoreductase n=1 Tax=Paenibacillus lignilyticus TaxID=1172615 RepID=A0ABS5CHH8_9BACL|nr:SDR family oxidoreductase [Paenibacillus lignilyticus]MBP3965300.1 SDR family oxidoreductase [Paenibacillus lignilyticus]
MSKTILITGASAGIGLATALKFAQNGWIVYAGTRQLERDQEQYARYDNLHFREMEVTDPDAIRTVVDEIKREQKQLDVLFCNAGIGYLRALGQAPMQEIEHIFDTNVFGVMHTIQAALPMMQKAGHGHIIATSSVGGLVGQPMNEIYCASKFAIEGLFESLATYYKPFFNIDVTLLEPGAIATNFTQSVLGHVASTGGIPEDEYKPIIDQYTKSFLSRNAEPQSADAVAEVMWELVAMEEKPLRIRTSERAEQFAHYKTQNDPTGLDGVRGIRKLQLGIED